MFKWKIYIYKDIDWKKEEFEKEFRDEEEFDDFLKKNKWFGDLSLIGASHKWQKELKELSRLFEEMEEYPWNYLAEQLKDDLDRIFEKHTKLLK